MTRLLLFNPENDIRLGETPGLTPRRLTSGVSALIHDGTLLPLWWARDSDYILVKEKPNPAMMIQAKRMRDEFGLKGNLLFKGDKATVSPVGEPWGWSYDSLRVLTESGARCPSHQAIGIIRQLSHRRTIAEIAQRLTGILPFRIPEPAIEYHTKEEVINFLKVHSGGFVKTPWSSSGRGVMKMQPNATERDEKIVEAAIRRQGSVMCESVLAGIQDFAMLFHANSGLARYMGLSVFNTLGGTVYSGNLIAHEKELEATIASKGARVSELDAVRDALQQLLTEKIAPYYSGWMGVDMMVLADGSLAPCVELNLRMTMGVVAWYMARKLPETILPCRYSVGPVKNFTGGVSATCANTPGVFEFNISKTI